MRPAFLFALLVACGFASAPLRAHDSPEHVVEALTVEMAKTGPTADLLYRRAVEYRALRKYAEAEKDLTAALTYDPELFAATFALAELLVAQRQWDRGEKLVEPLVAAESRFLRAAGLSLRGRMRAAQGDWKSASADFDASLALQETIETYLLRAKAQAELGKHSEQIAGLRHGLEKTDSPVLLRALCDALIDAKGKHLAEAKKIVDREIAASRFKSSWLVRRARIHFLRQNTVDGLIDLEAALTELNDRLDERHRDPMLEWERKIVVHALSELERAPFYLSVPSGLPPLRLFKADVVADAPKKPTRIEP